ncbi:MAG: site-specific integrase [Erysipelotrichaceae bacterium]|nr:site-specific integrase [Erysipelotrichaceae bacterium]
MSVHKDPKTGKWYYTGKYRDLSGERHDYKKRGFDRQRDAKAAEEAFLLKIKGGKGRIKMSALVELYQQDATTAIKESTRCLYKHYEELCILPSFGNKFIDEIKSLDIRRWINDIAVNGINGRIYCDSQVAAFLHHLSGLFSFAVNHELLSSNPCQGIKPPKNPNEVKKKKVSESNFWEVDEFNEFIATVENQDHKEIYEFLFLTGVRIGEFAALQWMDIDLENKKLHITKSLSGRTSKITSPKTENSIRVIDIPNRLNESLKARYERCKKLDGFNDDYYVFADVRWHHSSTYRRWFDADVEKSGVRKITIHGLRHSHASYLLSNPMMSEILFAERLGHTVTMLRTTYAHVYEKHRALMVEFIDEL